MKLRTLIAVAAAGALAAPMVTYGQTGGPAGASAQGTGVTGGVPRTGGPGPARASMGEPQDFTAMDRDSDGQISRTEWDDHYGSAAAGASARGVDEADDNRATTDRTPASEPRGTTGGTGAASSRTGPGSATATQPDTSGHGVPK